jgi:hypothetical protein
MMTWFWRSVGLTLAAAAWCSVAAASDFLVVKSGDATIAKGSRLPAGQQLALAAGASLTLMSASGEIVRLVGGPQGVRLPDATSGARSASLDIIQTMVSRPRARRDFGAMRGADDCTVARESLITLEAIAAADQIPACRSRAMEALNRIIDAQPPSQTTAAPTPSSPGASSPAAARPSSSGPSTSRQPNKTATRS